MLYTRSWKKAGFWLLAGARPVWHFSGAGLYFGGCFSEHLVLMQRLIYQVAPLLGWVSSWSVLLTSINRQTTIAMSLSFTSSVRYLGLTWFYCCSNYFAHGQAGSPRPPRWQEPESCFYIGAEGITLANQFTRFAKSAPHLAAADKDLAPRPAFVVGYRFSPRWAVETRLQDLAVMTGYSYQQETADTYLGFGQSYTQDYLYIPTHAVYKVVGISHRVGLSILAGGGPAWTDTKQSPITPNGTQVFYGSSNGTIGTGPAPMPGTTISATVTQLITQQQGLLTAFEAGIRGDWFILPRLSLNLGRFPG